MEEGTERRASVVAPYGERYDEVLTVEALTFLGELHEEFEGRRQELLEDRRTRWERITAGEDPDFSPKQRIFEKIAIGGLLR
jgi:malate synthase